MPTKCFSELIKLAAGFFGTAVSSGMLQVQDVVAGNKHAWMARTWGLGRAGWELRGPWFESRPYLEVVVFQGWK